MTGLPKNATNPFSSTDWPPPELLQLLRQLPHLTGRRKPYHHDGRRTAGLQTSGIEMADFRRYSQGEDYRLIDQFALARLVNEKLMIGQCVPGQLRLGKALRTMRRFVGGATA